jgi:hypothetical protein
MINTSNYGILLQFVIYGLSLGWDLEGEMS